MSAFLGVRVAVEAGHLQLPGVQPVGEGDRLDRLVALLVAGQSAPPQAGDQYQKADSQPGKKHGRCDTGGPPPPLLFPISGHQRDGPRA